MWKDDCFVTFTSTANDEDNGERFSFEFNIPFADENDDVIILKLTKSQKPTPKGLYLCEEKAQDKGCIIYGYTQNNQNIPSLSLDPAITAYNKEETLDRDIKVCIRLKKHQILKLIKFNLGTNVLIITKSPFMYSHRLHIFKAYFLKGYICLLF